MRPGRPNVRHVTDPRHRDDGALMNAPNSHRFLSGQLGRTSAPTVPHFLHIMRGSNDFTVRSPGQ
jgi:hypothetical protein